MGGRGRVSVILVLFSFLVLWTDQLHTPYTGKKVTVFFFLLGGWGWGFVCCVVFFNFVFLLVSSFFYVLGLGHSLLWFPGSGSGSQGFGRLSFFVGE